VLERGRGQNTYGTGCFLLENIGTEFMRSRAKLITTVAASTGKRLEYALEAASSLAARWCSGCATI